MVMPSTIYRAPDPRPSDNEFRFDADAMSVVVSAQWMPLVRLAALLLTDRGVAEEVVQQACEDVWRRRPAVGSPDQLVAYLRTSVVNRARSVGRRRSTAARHLALVRAEHEMPADHDLLLHEDRRLIRAAVSKLPVRQREVLVLRYWGRLTETDIARTLDISPGTVKSTAHHAIATLRTYLKGQS